MSMNDKMYPSDNEQVTVRIESVLIVDNVKLCRQFESIHQQKITSLHGK